MDQDFNNTRPNSEPTAEGPVQQPNIPTNVAMPQPAIPPQEPTSIYGSQPNSFSQPQYQQQPQIPLPTQTKKPKIAIYSIIAFLAGVLAFGLVYFFVISKAEPAADTSSNSSQASVPAAELTRFIDPNFTMMIPKSWSGDAGYEPGAQLVLYYSPEDASHANIAKAYRMSVYVGSHESRIDDQLDSLKQSGTKYEIKTDENITNDGVDSRYIELVISPNEQPDNSIRIASVMAKRGNFLISADISGLAEHWDLHKEVVPQILKSIKPACDNPNLDKFNTQSNANLCE